MNNRKDFLEWMKHEKGISFFESRKYLWSLDARNSVSKLFSISSVDELPKSESPEIKLYAEFVNERFPKPDRIEHEGIINLAPEVILEERDVSIVAPKDDVVSGLHRDSEKSASDELKPIIEEKDKQGTDTNNRVAGSFEANAIASPINIHKPAQATMNADVAADMTVDAEENASAVAQDKRKELCETASDGDSRIKEYALQEENIAELHGPIPENKEIDYSLFSDYLVSDSEKKVLDGDFTSKKSAYCRLKKESFRLLSEIYDNAFMATKIRDSQTLTIDGNGSSAGLVFDIVSGQVADLSDGSISEMTSYVTYRSDGKESTFPRNKRAFYYSDNISPQKSTATAFLNKSPSLDVIQKSIRDTIESHGNIDVDTKTICLVPDSLGDFRDNIKGQIQSSGSNVIQIPRSIAAVYSFAKSYSLEQDARFVCYDYNSSNLCRTEIGVHFNSETMQHEFTRMRRHQVLDETYSNFDKIARKYLEAYAKKHHLSIPQIAIKTLIETRDILKIISKGQSLPVEVKGAFLTIDCDRDLIDDIADAVMDEVTNDAFEADYCLALLDVNTSVNGFAALDYLIDGCREIQKRIKKHEDIWMEYLPELSLEVIRNGVFDNLKLIDKGVIQKISESSMDENVHIPLKDGSFSFPIGNGRVFCPLIREEYGSKQRDKMAMFDDDQIAILTKAFGKEVGSVQVNLTLTYHYGDPDSYKLTAIPYNYPEIQIQSQWCDEADQRMDNNLYPEYHPQSIITKSVDLETVISRFYENLDKDWYYSQTGVHGDAPFDKKGNWLVVTPLTYSIVSIQNLFSPQNILQVPPILVSKMESVIEQLLGLLDDAENDTLNFGDCDFEWKHFQYVKNSLLNVLSMLGGLCCSDNVDTDVCERLIRAVMGTKSYYRSRYLLQLSTYISREDDQYGIWNAINEYLPRDKNPIVAVRTIGSVCWRNPNWIYSFGKCNEKLIQSVIDTAISYCSSEIYNIGYDYNPRSIRDALEALLGIIRLKETNADVVKYLDCNSRKIKEFVLFLKELNTVMNAKASQLKHPFVSRLDIEVPESLNRTSSVVYPLIELLTGGNAIKLTGFTED